MPHVAILMGSAKDEPKVAAAGEMLDRFGVEYHQVVASAHRSPDRVASFASQAREQGYKVIIAAAGKAAHLAGAVAAQTTLPVIGLPIAAGGMGGLDALLATVQMPTGVPVATVAVDGSANAALLALQILAVEDADLARALQKYKEELAS